MTNEEIFGIINYVNSFSFSEFEMETQDIKIRIKKDGAVNASSVSSNDVVVKDAPKVEESKEQLPSVVAPITGVFYESPAPGENAFVSVGDHVKKGDTLCILEAMKMMNEVKSDKNGIIKEILATDGDSVDESAVLFVFQGE